MTIKHIVLCGGGPIGMISYGAIKNLINNKIIKYENIKSVYSTSVGCFIALFILLNLDYEWIDDYLIKRPWENLINFSSVEYFNIFYTKGLCDENFFINCFKPLFLAADIPINITLKEFYEINKIDWHIFTSNLSKFSKVDLNHKTHPNLSVIQAIIMSSSIPILIKPPYYNNEYYLDGGIFTNCPLSECIKNEKCNENEIISFENDKRAPIDISNTYFNNKLNNSNNELSSNINLFNFLLYIIKTLFKKFMVIGNENYLNIKNTINVCIASDHLDINYWIYVLNNTDERLRLIKLGEELGNIFTNKYNYTDISNINTDISNINTYISNNYTDISNINTNISNINTDISNNYTDISNNFINNDISFENIIIESLNI